MRLPEARRRAAALGAWLDGRPGWQVLGPLVVTQWVLVAALALSVSHNGWLFYQGGDQTWLYSTAYSLSLGDIPASYVGYGWSYLLAPIAWVAGPSFLAALPGIVLFQQLVLVPIALLSVYGILASLGGKRLGYFGAAVWITAPFLAIPLFEQRYHERYVEQFLPQALGLTGMADFPSMVLLLAASCLVLRALDTRDELEIALAGLLVGFAIGVKPANAIFLAAPFLALALARRRTSLVVFALALVPAVTTLALWKFTGLGTLPLLNADAAAPGAGGDLPGVSPPGVSPPDVSLPDVSFPGVSLPAGLGRYIDVDWGRIGSELDQVREYFYSVRFLEWLALAGTLAVARRSIPKAAFIATWLFAFLIVKGLSDVASVQSGSTWRLIMPGFPPLLLSAAALPLLLARKRRAGPTVAPLFRGRSRLAAFAAAAAVLALGPAVLIARSGDAGSRILRHPTEGTLITADLSWQPRVGSADGAVRLTWPRPDAGASHPYYVVFRVLRETDIRCESHGDSQSSCIFDTDQAFVTRARTLTDHPPDGTWTYRIGLAANWRDLAGFGDVLMVGAPLTVNVPHRRS